MKFVIFFADMLRANLLFASDKRLRGESLEQLLSALGGNFFSNCITEAPDTPRSTGIFFSGQLPVKSGIQRRSQWPGPHTNLEDKSLFSWAMDSGAKLRVIDGSIEHAGLFFPVEIQKRAQFYPDLECLNSDFQKMGSAEHEIIFIVSKKYHRTVDFRLGHKSAHRTGAEAIAREMKSLVEVLNLGLGDQLYLYSDHGCKLSGDSFDSSSHLNRDRSQVVFFQTSFTGSPLKVNNDLYSMVDIHHIVSTNLRQLMLDSGREKGTDLILPPPRELVHVEDYDAYPTKIGEIVRFWAVFGKEFEYYEGIGTNPVIKLLSTDSKMTKQEVIKISQSYLHEHASNYAAFKWQYNSLTQGFSAIEPIQAERWPFQTRPTKKDLIPRLMWRFLALRVSGQRRISYWAKRAFSKRKYPLGTGSGQKLLT